MIILFNRNPRYFVLILNYLLLFLISLSLSAAPLFFEPVKKILPDGSVLNIYVSGDEFFNYLHDASGYPVREGEDGFYYYVRQEGSLFSLTSFRAGDSDPSVIPGIRKVIIPEETRIKREDFFAQIRKYSETDGQKSLKGTTGLFNNLAVYIRFAGETEFSVSRSSYESRFNSLSTSSLRHYYREVSYNKLDVITYHLPGDAVTGISYQDIYPRNYYRPYDETTNPGGYKTSAEKTSREHTLLASAINWVSNNYALPSGVNFDRNSDGMFDNVAFIVRGEADGWSDLLWPHRWVLYSSVVKFGNLRVYGYTLQLENVSVTTLVHEMFHSFGAPDLYHYDNNSVPVGPWDIMGSGRGHMSTWMKYKYGGWLNGITEIKGPGIYTIKPSTESSINSYLLRSPNSSEEFFIIEFRKKTGLYESNLPGNGIIIKRIDTRYRGNANGPPDEVYVFRNNGGYNIAGDINAAAFSNLSGRTAFSDNTNPYSFLQDGSKAGIEISEITYHTDSMTFKVNMSYMVNLTVDPSEDTTLIISWKSIWNNDFLVALSDSPEILTAMQGTIYKPGDRIGTVGRIVYSGPSKTVSVSGLKSDRNYFFTVWAILSKNPYSYSVPSLISGRTGIFTINRFPYIQDFDETQRLLPRGWKSQSDDITVNLNQGAPFSEPYSLELMPGSSGDNWLFTPAFSLMSTKKYMISFRYRNREAASSESLLLKTSSVSREYIPGTGVTISDLPAFSFSGYVLNRSVFRPSSSGVYFMGFLTGKGGKGVLIDDFSIVEVPLKTTEHLSPAEFYPNPSSGQIIIPSTGRTEITIYSTGGVKLYETFIEGMQEKDFSFLGKGIYIIRFKTAEGVSQGKLVII